MKKDKSKTKRFRPKLHIRKGDNVYVLAGDDRGKTGRVIEVIVKDLRALVEGVNIISRHTKPNTANPNGGIIKKEAPVHISNLALIDPQSGKPTRIGRRKEGDKNVRYSRREGNALIK